MKKTLSLLMLLVMALSLLTGCTPDELSYLGISQEVNSLDAYTMTGTMTWDADLEGLLDTADNAVLDTPASKAEVIRLIEKEGLKKISFDMSVNMKQNALSASYSAGGNKLFTFVLLNDTFYLNADGIIDMVRRNDADAVQNSAAYEKLAALKGKYLSLSPEELSEAGILPSEISPATQLKGMLTKRQQLNRNIMTYFMDYAKKDLAGYSTGLVKKSYNSSLGADVYRAEGTLEQMPLVGMSFAMTVLDHLDGTEAFLLKVVNDPLMVEQTGHDAASLSEEVKSGIAEIRSDLVNIRQTLDTAMTEEKASKTYGTQIKALVGDVSFSAELAKLQSSKYFNSVSFSYKSANPFSSFRYMNLNVQGTVNAGSSPTISVPGSTVPFMTFNATLPHTLVLEPDYGSATYTAGLLGDQYLDAEMYNIDGYWFIDKASLPGPFGAMIVQNGSTFTLGGQALDATDVHVGGGKTLIAVKAFKKAGVTITWDETDRTITLDKQ